VWLSAAKGSQPQLNGHSCKAQRREEVGRNGSFSVAVGGPLPALSL